MTLFRKKVVGTTIVSQETFDELAGSLAALSMFKPLKDGVIVFDDLHIIRGSPRQQVAEDAREELDPIARHRARTLSGAPSRVEAKRGT